MPQPMEESMLAKWVKVRVKPEMRKRFLEAIEVDALGSERDAPGCMRYIVLQADADKTVYYYYVVFLDEASIAAHRAAPHYAVWKGAADTLDGPIERIDCTSVFPSDKRYWTRNK
jgi:autoinducer 2-degrading protein